ncbi:phosphatases II [Cylindrobasidium torrendii FP15055 ss-10]|uniref:Phosphatases II n=1 Tax=Cylindrobasidium torrendii FP15055 ss-10 TaxID=1314674 RepID=A0A0D7B6L8_9AGAR|nr:phosphatases II [Cylindrobasidium torrendii FP15055 ss-10]
MTVTFKRFVEVLQHVSGGRRLFRSSAPGYDDVNEDAPQNLTADDIEVLTSRGITRIVSLNEQGYTPAALERLKNAGIAYLHLPVVDFTAPSMDQIKRAVTFWSKAPKTNMLVHCGYGHGRTGTMITALQLWMTNGHLGLDSTMTANYVEREVQREVLRRYQAELMNIEL